MHNQQEVVVGHGHADGKSFAAAQPSRSETKCGALFSPAGADHVGIDFLDFEFRIEKRFGIKIAREDSKILEEWAQERRSHLKPHDLTAGELHDWVVRLLEDRQIRVPYSCWNAVKLELAKVVKKPPQIIHRETLIVHDLGFS